jgi:hypothetical protein
LLAAAAYVLHDGGAAGNPLSLNEILKLSRPIKKLGHFEVLIIDHLGYVQQSRE